MALTMVSLAAIADRKPTAASAQLVAEGRESAARLYALLVGSSVLHGPLDLAEQILLCFDRALAKLHGVDDVAGAEDDGAAGNGNGRKRKPGRGLPASSAAASSKRMRVSNGGGNGARIERKATMDDKFLWRKYGQKEIKNNKYPRFYYRCSYKDDHGCTATKQVQQSETDDDDTASPVYVITYFGEHTCRPGIDAAAMVADGGEEEDQLSPTQMVISFASSGGGGDASVSWPCSGDDAQNNSETSHESSPPDQAPAEEEERLRPCTAAGVSDEPIMESTPPAPELLADLKPMDGCLLDGESLFGMDELVYFHELSAALGLLDRDWAAPAPV